MAQNRETRQVQNPALLAVGARPDVMIWRQQSGVFRAFDNPQQVIRVGQPGMSDSLAVVAVTITPEMVGKTVGVAVAAEYKTDTGRQSEAQRNWQAAFQKRGGIYHIIRSAAEMVGLVERVQRGQW